MGVTFINKPNGSSPDAEAQNLNIASGASVNSGEITANAANKLRNDLLPSFTVGMIAPSALVSGHYTRRCATVMDRC